MGHRGQGDVCVHCSWDVIGSWLFQYTKQGDFFFFFFFFFEGKNAVFILIFLTLFKFLKLGTGYRHIKQDAEFTQR